MLALRGVRRALLCVKQHRVRCFVTYADLTTQSYVNGQSFNFTIPLPSRPGLTEITLALSDNVKDLVAQIKSLDPSLKQVEVANGVGQRIAGVTALYSFAYSELYINLQGTHVRIVAEDGPIVPDAALAPQKYAQLKEDVRKLGATTVSIDKFRALCTEVGADKQMTKRWLQYLTKEGIVSVVQAGQTVILNPSGDGFKQQVGEVLRRDDELLGEKIKALEAELREVESKEKAMEQLRDDIFDRARRNARIKGTGVLALMTTQFCGLAYCVYEVWSWDVMEPLTYFLMLSYSVGGSLYFSAKKRQATYDNLLQTAVRKHQEKLGPTMGYRFKKHAEITAEVDRTRSALAVLKSRLGEHDSGDMLSRWQYGVHVHTI